MLYSCTLANTAKTLVFIQGIKMGYSLIHDCQVIITSKHILLYISILAQIAELPFELLKETEPLIAIGIGSR